jgi:hypothetical protein
LFFLATTFYVWLYLKCILLKLFNFKGANNFIIAYLCMKAIWCALPYLGYYSSYFKQNIPPFGLAIAIIQMLINILLGISILQLRDSRIKILRYYCYAMMFVAPMAVIFFLTNWIHFVYVAHNLILVASLYQLDNVISADDKNQDNVTA